MNLENLQILMGDYKNYGRNTVYVKVGNKLYPIINIYTTDGDRFILDTGIINLKDEK